MLATPSLLPARSSLLLLMVWMSHAANLWPASAVLLLGKSPLGGYCAGINLVGVLGVMGL